MSIKARLRIAIVALVTVVVVVMSALYLYDFTRMSFQEASGRAALMADEVKGNLLDRLERQMAARGLHPTSTEEWKRTWTEIVRSDPNIAGMLKRTLATDNLVVAILVADDHGKVLAASDPDLVRSPLPPAEDFRDLQRDNWFGNLWDLFTQRENYVTRRPIGVEQEKQVQVLFTINVVIRSVLLKHAIQPALKALAVAFGVSLLVAIVLASVLPNLVLDPLQRVSRSIDLIRTGQFDTANLPVRESREFADVQSKLSLLGQQFRGAQQNALELRSNVEQLLQRLEEAVLLFDNTGRLMMASDAAERLVGKQRDELLGHTFEEVFPAATVMGDAIGGAVQRREPLRDQPVTVPRDGAGNTRLLVSVEVLRSSPNQQDIGTLITLRDAESRRQLERQLDISSRLAAISRLTGGVAHEIKNPLNAMALHLEVLKGKLDAEQPEVDVIEREIKRLDSVVKTFLSFNKPIELQAKPIDLAEVVQHVVALVSVDAQAKNIALDAAPGKPLWINGDPDLIQQAILNIVNNGMEAMREGGTLAIRTEFVGGQCEIAIADAGPGIPREIQDKVFNLYFTTKEKGSGIGLATTFRVVQLHSGTIDFVSELGKGTTFRLRFPSMADYRGEALTSVTSSS